MEICSEGKMKKTYPLFTKKQNDKINMFKYIFEYLLNHSVQCSDKTCLCYASTWNDALADMKNITDEYNNLIDEIFRRDEKRYGG